MNNLPAMRAFLLKTWWVFAFALLLWLAGSYYAYHANEAAYNSLYRAALAGKIRSLAHQNHGFSVAVELDNDRRYRFFPVEQDGGAAGFLARAAVGDSVQKRNNSDTLVLVTPTQKTRYAFKKVLY